MRTTSLAAWTLAAAFALPAAAAGQPPPTLTPGPEHQVLKMDAGTWDAVVEVSMPGAPPMTSKGVEVNTMGCGGLCLITDFKGDFMPGVPFHGHGVTTWDARKKKYTMTWTDSMSTGLATGESTWNADKKQLAGWMEGADASGQVMKTRSVLAHTPAGRVFTAYAPGPDGKEAQMMKITYTKRK
jgi:hypothetical protein